MSSDAEGVESSQLAEQPTDNTVDSNEPKKLDEEIEEELDCDSHIICKLTESESVAENIVNACCETEHDTVVIAQDLSMVLTAECSQQVQTDEPVEVCCDSSIPPEPPSNENEHTNINITTTPCPFSLVQPEQNIRPEPSTKPRGGRSYQESRRSKKTASGALLGSGEKYKLISVSTISNSDVNRVDGGSDSSDLCPSNVEHRAKGDVKELVVKSIGREDDLLETNIDCRPACDGDPLASGKLAEKPDVQSCREDLMKLLKKSPSMLEKRPAASTCDDKQVCSKLEHDAALKASDLEAQWKHEADLNRSQAESETNKAAIVEKQLDDQKDQEQAELQRVKDEEIKSLQDFINEVRERIESKSILREQNLSAAECRPDESFFVKLDSNLKRNTAFVKKLRNLTETQRDALIKDFNSLNLTMYVGEMVDAIVEAKLKMTDVGCALTLSSLIHQRYAEFSSLLLDGWHKVLLTKKDDKVPNASKLRVDLRLFADLIAVGVFTEKEGLPVLANQLTLLTNNDREEHNNLSIVLSFCKHCGDDYAGLLPRKFRLLAEKYETEIPRSQVLKGDRQKACRNLLKDYYSSLCKHLLHDCKELRAIEKQNRRILQTKGELSAERKEKLEAAQQSFQRLLQNTQALADLLDDDVPSLPEEESKTDLEGFGMDTLNATKTGAEFQPEGDLSLYDDEDTRQFYENLPDLKAIIPGILYKDSELAATASVSQTSETADDELDEDDMELLADTVEGDCKPDNKAKSTTSKKQENKKEEEALPDVDSVIPPEVEDDDTDIAGSMKVLVETFLNNLSNCVNRELIDKASVEFCMNLNTKANRRKLVRALFFVHRTRYDLLPFYARLVASLNPCVPSIALDLAIMLKTDFRIHVRKKDQINIESKLKTVRFIGELVKFDMFLKADALQCLKMLLFDFKHHNIEMACALLETCGRYLYRTPESHQRVKVYLEVMVRKKTALHLDARYSTMIENALVYSNPPEARSEARLQQPPMHEYIHKLVYKDLSKTNVEKVLRQMRKLNWDNSEIRHVATKCLADVWNLRFNNIHCCANLLAGLAPYEESVGIHVVDAVLEEVWLGLEVNHPKYNQHRISTVKYLGELYNYRMVESQVIFRTLYLLITFGVSFDDAVPTVPDPPEHLFRIRLVCILLDTCGQYFDRGSSKKKLDCFLVYFQRYYWYKKKNPIWTEDHPFPREVEYVMADTIEALRPKLRICSSWEEASQAAEALDKEFAAKLAELLKINDKASVQLQEQPGSLGAIHEADEHEGGQAELTGDTQEDSDGETLDQTDAHSPSPSQSQKGDDCQYDDEGNQARTFEDDQEYMDSADEEEMDHMAEGEDDKAARNVGLKVLQCAEDDDFMAAFDKMMSETLQTMSVGADQITSSGPDLARVQEVVKIPIVDIAVPVNIKSQQKSKQPQPQPPMLQILSNSQSTSMPQGDTQSPEEDPVHRDNAIPFTILSKRGNKQQFATINIPVNETFAAKFKEQIELEKMEKERMKRVVLNIHERQEEEDYQEMIAQLNKQMPTNINRDRRVPYQHPKGAPDADVIFGSKKR